MSYEEVCQLFPNFSRAVYDYHFEVFSNASKVIHYQEEMDELETDKDPASYRENLCGPNIVHIEVSYRGKMLPLQLIKYIEWVWNEWKDLQTLPSNKDAFIAELQKLSTSCHVDIYDLDCEWFIVVHQPKNPQGWEQV